MTNILGVDQSYTGFGYSIHPLDSESRTEKISFSPSRYDGQGDRLSAVYKWLRDLLVVELPEVVVMEGYGFATKFGRELAGELGGIVKTCIWETLRLNPLIVPPTTLKKFVTGSGNAPKNLMLQQVYKRWGKEFSDDNMADAFSLAMFGKAYEGIYDDMPKAMMDVVVKFKKDQEKAG